MTLVVVILAVVTLVSIGVVGFLAQHFHAQAERGWKASAATNREVRNLLMARVTTLENRLQTDSLESYAQLQHVPDELAKSVYADMHSPSDNGLTRDGSLVEEMANSVRAEDLEGDNWEGPTVG